MKPDGSEKLYIVPCSKEKACEFVTYLHRHHLPLEFGSYCLAVATGDGVIHGVAIIGRTTTQHYEAKRNHWILEVRRVATDGTKNACSALYGAAWRMARDLGFQKMISYTLPEEGGASLRALGWKRIDDVGGNSWAHRSKRGTDIAPTTRKTRWEVEIPEETRPPFNEIKWPVYDSIQSNLFSEPTVVGAGVGARLKKEAFIQTGFAQDTSLFDVLE